MLKLTYIKGEITRQLKVNTYTCCLLFIV